MLGALGPMELVVILVIAVIIFGPKRIPQMGRALGETIKEFRKAGHELTKDHETDDKLDA